MPDGFADPGNLEGDDLVRWYRRSPWEVEQQRQAALRRRYNEFFGVDSDASDQGVKAESGQDVKGATYASGGVPSQSPSPTTFSAPVNGTGGADASSSAAASTSVMSQWPKPIFDARLSTPGDVDWLEIGGKTPGQRRLWEQHTGQSWPTVPETGANYHLHHIIPKADGGGEGLDNYGPMEPSAHRQHHIDNGDFSRWAKRRGLSKPGMPEVNGLGLLQIIPDITGILSGRIRMDSMDNFFSDMIGVPSQEDIRQYQEQRRKELAPDAPPGPIVGEL